MSLNQPEFLKYVQKMFRENGADYDNLKSIFGEEFEIFCHFYYFICNPEKSEYETRDELRFVGMTSLMEALISKLPRSPKGYRSRVRMYFKHYFAHDTKKITSIDISIWSKETKEFIPLVEVQAIADLLYSMRSEFVHEAQMHSLNPVRYDATFTKVGKEFYYIKLSVDQFLKEFEASFVFYWTERRAV